MHRRDLIKKGGIGGLALMSGKFDAIESAPFQSSASPFNLNYAIHEGLFYHHAGKEIIDQINFAHDLGFRSYEDNSMRLRPPERQTALGNALAKKNMTMGVFVGHSLDWKEPTLTKNDKELNEKFLSEIRESVNVAKRCGSTRIVVVPGVINHGLDIAFQRANFMDLIRRAVDIVAPHKLTLLLEPLNFRDHPSQLLPDIPTLYQFVKSINSENCRLLFDVYHVQIHSGNIIPNIDLSWDAIDYFQVADNPGRMEPLTGEINYHNVFAHIYNKGFRGIVGMEHSNSVEGKQGEMKVVEAYRQCDNFKAKTAK